MLERILYAISFGFFSGFLLLAFNLEGLFPILGGIIVFLYKGIQSTMKDGSSHRDKYAIKYQIIMILAILGLISYLLLYHIENIYVVEILIFVFLISIFNKRVQTIIYSLIILFLIIKPSIFLYSLPFFPYLIQEYLL